MENNIKRSEDLDVTFDEELEKLTIIDVDKTVTYQIPADVADIIKIMWLVKPFIVIKAAIIDGYLNFDTGFEDPFQSIRTIYTWLTAEEYEEIIKKIKSYIDIY